MLRHTPRDDSPRRYYNWGLGCTSLHDLKTCDEEKNSKAKTDRIPRDSDRPSLQEVHLNTPLSDAETGTLVKTERWKNDVNKPRLVGRWNLACNS